MTRLNTCVFCVVSVAIMSMGFVSVANAGIVTTADAIAAAERTDRLSRIDTLLSRKDVRGQLLDLGVDPEQVAGRLASLSDAEIAMLNRNLESQVAGGDALGVIGAVFLVLLILELVGVTDIFKSI